MAVTISAKNPVEVIPEGYIRNKHGKLVKKPIGRVKGVITTKRKERMLEKMTKTEQQESLLTAQKIVAANELTTEQIRDEAQTLIKMKKPTSTEGSMERRTGILAMVYKLQIRGLTEDQIGQQLQLPLKSVRDMLREVEISTRLDPKKLDVGFFMGETLSFHQEIRQMALLMTAEAGATRSDKLNAMRVAMDAEHRKNEFLTRIGVYNPTVLKTIEHWVLGSTEAFTAPPAARERVNLAAEAGRALARRNRDTDVQDVASK